MAADPLAPQAYAELAMVHMARGDAPGALRALEQGFVRVPSRSAELHFEAGRLYATLGDTALALEHLRAAYPRGPYAAPTRLAQTIARLEGLKTTGTR